MKLTCLSLGILFCAFTAQTATLTVNSTSDNLTSDNFLTLREAITLIDFGGVATNASSLGRALTAGEQAQISGSFGVNDKVMLPAGTYVLSIVGAGEGLSPALPKIGDLDITPSGVTIQGAGASSTIIQQTSPQDRIFDVNVNFIGNFVFTLDGVTIFGGRETSGVAGGGVFTGSSSGTNGLITIKNCRFVNNRASGAGSLGGGAWAHTGGHAIATNCIFGGNGASDPNSSSSSGGAVYLDAYGTVATLTVTNCTFSNNVTGSGGGALDVAAINLGVGTYNIGSCIFFGNRATNGSGGAIQDESVAVNVSACNFISNSAAIAGGAIFSAGGSNSTVRYNRFIGNNATNAANGQAIHNNGGVGFTANDNWWGVNTGPTASDIKNLTATTWLQLRHTANPSTIVVPNSTTLTATLLTNSAGTFIPSANLSGLLNVPILFNNAVRGSLSGAGTTLQSGTATATFTANAVGAGSANAVVDSQTVTGSVTVAAGVSSINRVQATPTNLTSVQWTVTFTSAVTNVTAGNFGLVNGGLAGSPGITSVTPVGGSPAASWTVTASTGSGTGTLGLNMTNGTGISAAIANLPFTGQVYSIDQVAPNTTITNQPPNPANSTASFSFTGSDTGVGIASFQCRLDSGSFTNCTSPVNFSGLANGSHTFEVRAIDLAGNTDPTPASVTWVVDAIPPSISIGAPSATLTRTGIVTYLVTYADVNFNASTLNATNVTLNKTGTANGTVLVTGSGTNRTVTITNTTGDGTIGISIAAGTASDTVGNLAPAAGPSATFIVDNTAPTISCPTNVIVDVNAGTCTATNVALGSPVTSDANGVGSVSSNAPSSYPAGTNIVTWTVRDNVGLSNTCTQLVIVRDTIAPSISCPSNITVNATGNCPRIVTFTVGASDNCNLTNLVVTPGTGSLFPIGTNIVNALAQDAAGNSNTCSFTVTVVAGTAPQLRVAQQETNTVVWWPDTYSCYTLQFAPTLQGSNIWTTYSGPWTTNGGNIYVTNTITGTNRFYRLIY